MAWDRARCVSAAEYIRELATGGPEPRCATAVAGIPAVAVAVVRALRRHRHSVAVVAAVGGVRSGAADVAAMPGVVVTGFDRSPKLASGRPKGSSPFDGSLRPDEPPSPVLS
jgi:hypothetical protein